MESCSMMNGVSLPPPPPTKASWVRPLRSSTGTFTRKTNTSFTLPRRTLSPKAALNITSKLEQNATSQSHLLVHNDQVMSDKSPLPDKVSTQDGSKQNFAKDAPGPSLMKLVIKDEGYCETVRVADDTIVAHIVGKGGARIKTLVRSYGANIETPVLGAEPVFVLKGPRNSVKRLKQAIQLLDAHFGNVQHSRVHKLVRLQESKETNTFRVYVPSPYAGVMIGKNGTWVRDLQTMLNVYIETPKPVRDGRTASPFVVIGEQKEVSATVERMFVHLCARTGRMFDKITPISPNEIHFVDVTPAEPRTHSVVMAHIAAQKLDRIYQQELDEAVQKAFLSTKHDTPLEPNFK